MKSALALRDPLGDLVDFRNRIASILRGDEGLLAPSAEGDWMPTVDVEEDATSFRIKADLPGVEKEQAKVVVKDGVLMISGERHREHVEEDKERKFHRVERSYGSFTRAFRLPEGVDPASIAAEFHDGVLEVRMPKGKISEPEAVNVEVR